MKPLLFCTTCTRYTLKASCCGIQTTSPRPPKYSPSDKYASYRRKAKEAMQHA